MKKLIAQRPIQYMGRTYERGEAIPAHDARMVAAWLRANSAAWTGEDTEAAVRAAVREAARRSKVNDLAAEAIQAMGVTIEDTAGEFVGVSSIFPKLKTPFKNKGPKCTVDTVASVDTVGRYPHFATIPTVETVPTVVFTPPKTV